MRSAKTARLCLLRRADDAAAVFAGGIEVGALVVWLEAPGAVVQIAKAIERRPFDVEVGEHRAGVTSLFVVAAIIKFIADFEVTAGEFDGAVIADDDVQAAAARIGLRHGSDVRDAYFHTAPLIMECFVGG